jgi:hypothetical protein
MLMFLKNLAHENLVCGSTSSLELALNHNILGVASLFLVELTDHFAQIFLLGVLYVLLLLLALLLFLVLAENLFFLTFDVFLAFLVTLFGKSLRL